MDKWSMIGLIIILFYPLTIGMLFGISYFIYNSFFINGNRLFGRHQSYLYLVFLFIFFIIILYISIKSGTINKIGMFPNLERLYIAFFIISIVLGIVIYHIEKSLTVIVKKYMGNIKFLITNIQSISEKQYGRQYLGVLIFLSILISFCEEFIWRGYLIMILKDNISVWGAILLSSLAFGINHYYFGILPVILKSLTGVFLGILYIITDNNIWAPFLTHSVFNIYLWLKLY